MTDRHIIANTMLRILNKSSSEDEIANVNVLRRHRTCTRGVQKVLRLTQLVTRYQHHILSLFSTDSWNLYRGHRAVPLQTFTTRYSNSKLSIVMALSTTFRQCAPETTKFDKVTQNKGHFAIQGLSLIHIWRCRRSYACRSRWSPYH